MVDTFTLGNEYVIPTTQMCGKNGEYIADKQGVATDLTGGEWNFGGIASVGENFLKGTTVGLEESADNYVIFQFTMPDAYEAGAPFSIVVALKDAIGAPDDPGDRQLAMQALCIGRVAPNLDLINTNQPVIENAVADYTFTAGDDVDQLGPGDLITVQVKASWYSTGSSGGQPVITQIRVVL